MDEHTPERQKIQIIQQARLRASTRSLNLHKSLPRLDEKESLCSSQSAQDDRKSEAQELITLPVSYRNINYRDPSRHMIRGVVARMIVGSITKEIVAGMIRLSQRTWPSHAPVIGRLVHALPPDHRVFGMGMHETVAFFLNRTGNEKSRDLLMMGYLLLSSTGTRLD